jgi:AraC-like DNA-binding protein
MAACSAKSGHAALPLARAVTWEKIMDHGVSPTSKHADYIWSVVDGARQLARGEEFSASWERSIRKYGLDPASEPVPHVLTPSELKERLEPVAELVHCARPEIDRLYSVLRVAGYAVILTDSNGIAVDLRGEVMPATHLKDLGSCVGGVWSEEVHGTNGIGTCIAEERQITVHRSQHFRTRHTHLSCSGAPIFGPDGGLLAALDVSSVDPSLSERAHALTGTLTAAAARAIEERYFRERFRGQWIVGVASGSDGPFILLAVDSTQRIIAADRAARTTFSLDDERIYSGVGLWDIFRPKPELFQPRHHSDVLARLTLLKTGEMRAAAATPPVMSRASLVLHTRPRLDILETILPEEPRSAVHGGLSPGIERRVAEYVEAHLAERIQLAEIAAVAGLSVFHFAREFKRTVGVSPHSFVTQKRVQRAQELLVHTNMPLSEIALAVGFFDQSHLARHFREISGLTPSEYRRCKG